MKSTNFNEVAKVFDAVVALPIDQRMQYLNRTCAGRDDLRREVQSLLNHDDVESDPLEQAGLKEVLAEYVSSDEPTDLSGQVIGPYKLMGRIAVGGMGMSIVGSAASLVVVPGGVLILGLAIAAARRLPSPISAEEI